MTQTFKLTLIWVAGSLAALVVGLAPLSAAFADGHYLPAGPDSFYHARRILDAVANPAGFYQFDTLMHAPEGSLITWPWGYDWLMSVLVRIGLTLHLSRDPMAILAHLPVVGFVLGESLMLLICRVLRLSLPSTALALLAMAFFPLNQTLYGVGIVDHHFAENLFVLAAVASGLSWLSHPDSILRACVAGIVLGLAPGVHAAEFVLQVPVVATFLWLWARNQPRPRNTPVFAMALVGASLVVALPSLALREGLFQFYTLSWFQVYVAACSAAICVTVSRIPFSRRNLAILGAVIVAMTLPVIGQVVFADRFFSNAIAGMTEISEVRSPWKMMTEPGGVLRVANNYTLLIYLLPATLALSAWRLWRSNDSARSFFWIACLFGLALLAQQLRMNYFGSFALYLPWVLLVDERTTEARVRPVTALILLGAILALAYAPGVQNQLFVRKTVSYDNYYEVARRIYAVLAEECARNPGIALAEPFDGHYIRYHTNCAVIANNFLLTPLHESKFLEERELMSLPAAQLLQRAPYLRYVYVRRSNLFYITPNNSVVVAPAGNPRDPDLPLVQELLTADPQHLPAKFRLVKELYFPGFAATPYARLFAIDRG